jgi:hypothetical protein
MLYETIETGFFVAFAGLFNIEIDFVVLKISLETGKTNIRHAKNLPFQPKYIDGHIYLMHQAVPYIYFLTVENL